MANNHCVTGLIFLISVALPIAMICMGSIYIDDCRIERYIPIYLIVAGAFAVLKAVLMAGWYILAGDDTKKGLGLISLINLFLFAWFIAGSYWIYHVHKEYQSDYKLLSSYCNKTLYLFAFWVQIIFFIIMAIEVIGGCIKFCCKK